MFVLRWIPRPKKTIRWTLWRKKTLKRQNNLITMDTTGSDIHLAISAAQWSRGGHHPSWCPDGETLLMNLNALGEGMRFIRAHYDGSHLQTLSDSIRGSGHPSLHPGERYIVTDAYPWEKVAYGDGTVPIRLIDLQNNQEETLVENADQTAL